LSELTDQDENARSSRSDVRSRVITLCQTLGRQSFASLKEIASELGVQQTPDAARNKYALCAQLANKLFSNNPLLLVKVDARDTRSNGLSGTDELELELGNQPFRADSLYNAIVAENYSLVGAILQTKDWLRTQRPASAGEPFLWTAVQRGQVAIARLLIAAGGDVNARVASTSGDDKGGSRSLLDSVRARDPSTARTRFDRMLLAAGARETPLDIRVSDGEACFDEFIAENVTFRQYFDEKQSENASAGTQDVPVVLGFRARSEDAVKFVCKTKQQLFRFALADSSRNLFECGAVGSLANVDGSVEYTKLTMGSVNIVVPAKDVERILTSDSTQWMYVFTPDFTPRTLIATVSRSVLLERGSLVNASHCQERTSELVYRLRPIRVVGADRITDILDIFFPTKFAPALA